MPNIKFLPAVTEIWVWMVRWMDGWMDRWIHKTGIRPLVNNNATDNSPRPSIKLQWYLVSNFAENRLLDKSLSFYIAIFYPVQFENWENDNFDMRLLIWGMRNGFSLGQNDPSWLWRKVTSHPLWKRHRPPKRCNLLVNYPLPGPTPLPVLPEGEYWNENCAPRGACLSSKISTNPSLTVAIVHKYL